MTPVVPASVIDDHAAISRLIGTILEASPNLAVVVVSGTDTMESVAEALQAGANDDVTKPIDRAKIVAALSRALQRKSVRNSGDLPATRIEGRTSPHLAEVVTASTAMQSALARLAKIAPTSFPILLQGETGVGKKLLARWIHARSQLAGQPFEHFACRTLRSVLPEPGPASWRTDTLAGGIQAVVRRNNAGCTLFLENIDQFPFPAQTELLDAMEGHWHRAFDDGTTSSSGLRIIASTESDLETALSSGMLHRGLYDSLNLFPVVVPSLRERPEDIRALTTHFIDQFCPGQDRNAATARRYLSDDLWSLMRTYAWPGNVRELMSVVARITLSENAAEVDQYLRGHLRMSQPQPARDLLSVALEGDLRSIERSVIREVVRRNGGNKAAAARALGMHRRTLYRLLEHARASPRPQAASPAGG